MGVKLPLGWSRTFLEALARRPVVTYACEAAGVSRSKAYRTKARIPAFARLWDLAVEGGRDRIESEAMRRGMEGVMRPVFGNLGDGLGTGVVGEQREYSDRLLETVLRAHKPEAYRERFEVRHTDETELDAEIVRLMKAFNDLGAGQPVPQE